MLISGDGHATGHQHQLEKGLRAMTMKEKLQMHKRIEAENRRKLAEWLAKQKKVS